MVGFTSSAIRGFGVTSCLMLVSGSIKYSVYSMCSFVVVLIPCFLLLVIPRMVPAFNLPVAFPVLRAELYSAPLLR